MGIPPKQTARHSRRTFGPSGAWARLVCVLTLLACGGDGNQVVGTNNLPPVTISTTSLSSATVGTPYSQILQARGGDGTYSWSMPSGTLPVGLTLNAGTGAITGTPTTVGLSNFVVRATSAGLSETRVLSITVEAAPVASVTILTTSLPGGTVGVAYAQTLAASGGNGTYTWSLVSGALPSGLTLNVGTGAIAGTPTAAGTASFTVQASSAGVAGAQALTLTIAPAGGSVAPNLVEDFSTYTSTANLLADPRNIYSESEDIAPSQIVLDTSVGFGSSTKSMRYDYPDMTRSGARCNGYTIGRNLGLSANQTEIWLEVHAKFASNWEVYPTWYMECNPVPNPDFKFLFGRMTQSSRFEMLFGNSVNGNLIVGYPGNEEAFTVPTLRARNYLDNQWHQYRFHFKTSGSSAGSGQVEMWIDGVRVANLTGITTAGGAANLIYSIALGRNRNHAAGSAQSLWWGSIKVWYAGSNPRW